MIPTADGSRGDDSPASRGGLVPERRLSPDILVVGGGPAGLAAAVAAHAAGADTLLIEEPPAPDSQYFKHAAGTYPPSARIDALRARAATVPQVHATVWGAFPGLEIAAATATARLVLRPRQLILVPGAYEVPVHLPGWTLPGCMTTGTLQALVRTGEFSPGRVVVAGNGPLNLQVAVELLRAGGQVSAVIDAGPGPAIARLTGSSPSLTGARRRSMAALRRAGVPVFWNTRPLAVLGTSCVAGVRIAGPGGVAVIPADAVALHWGFQAETSLARALGTVHRVIDGRLETVIDAQGRTSLPGVFAVDDSAPLMAVLRGAAAGRAAARALGYSAPGRPGSNPGSRHAARLRRAERFQSALSVACAAPPPDPGALTDDTIICRCEGVSAGRLRGAMVDGAASLATLKRATRAGMGQCTGRFCAAAIARMCGADTEAGFAAPRLPLRPVLAGAILADWADPQNEVVALPPPTRWLTAMPGTVPAAADVVVIGGGIIGLSTALYLARDGADVLLLDRNEPGAAASTANAGSLHIQLVPYVYQAGNGGPMADTLPLGPASVALWRALARDSNEDLGLRTEGGLVLAETEAELVLLRSKAAFERGRGIPSEVIGAADLRALAPGLDGHFIGAAFCPLEGQGDPLRGTMALLRLAGRAGVRIAAGVAVQGLARDGAEWRIDTAAGPVRAGQVVNAGGAQAGRIAAMAGVDVPMHGLVQQVIVTGAAAPLLRQLIAWTGRHLSLKQDEAGHLLVGGGWPGRLDAAGAAQVRRSSVEGNLALAARALPALAGVDVQRAWTGVAPHLDRGPVISATPGHPGLWHGVTGNGYTLGPVVGQMLAEAVRGRRVLPAAFAL